MERKVGDTIYFEYYDGTIGSRIILEIKDDTYINDDGVAEPYKYYITGPYTMIEDYNCLDENDPRVIEYIKNNTSTNNNLKKWFIQIIDDNFDERYAAIPLLTEIIEDLKAE